MSLREFGFYKLFLAERHAWAGCVLATFLAGLLQGVIVFIINEVAGTLMAGELSLRQLLLFLLTLGAYALVSHFAASRIVALAEDAIFTKYAAVADKLRNAATLAFESIGKAEIAASLETNVDIILEAAKSLAGVGAGVIMVAFCAAYVAFISPTAFVAMAVFYLFGVFVYATNMERIREPLGRGAALERRFLNLFGHFLDGFKELKTDAPAAEDLLANHMREASSKAKAARIEVEKRLTANGVFVQTFYYGMVGGLVFLLPQISDLAPVRVVTVAVIVLFSFGSVSRIVQAVPLLLKAEKALARLDRLDEDLSRAREAGENDAGSLQAGTRPVLRLSDVTFSYPGEDDRGFSLGPLSLHAEPGEIIFIVGGNGGGKTTLLKLIAGLYVPQNGSISLGETRIDADNADAYRNLFAVIFPDYHLFDRFYGKESVDGDAVNALLRKMGIAHRVSFADGRFSDLNLSAGQKKRMALVQAHFQGKPFLAIDEVAADLDPAFRQFFYETYLPELQRAGMTVIAVSHDERYFHVADRVIKLENGQTVASEPQTPQMCEDAP